MWHTLYQQIYDIGSFLAAAGGNLGLFLGFSCLTMLLNLYQFCKSFVFKQFQRQTLCCHWNIPNLFLLFRDIVIGTFHLPLFSSNWNNNHLERKVNPWNYGNKRDVHYKTKTTFFEKKFETERRHNIYVKKK